MYEIWLASNSITSILNFMKASTGSSAERTDGRTDGQTHAHTHTHTHTHTHHDELISLLHFLQKGNKLKIVWPDD
jgi:hypothetical protein